MTMILAAALAANASLAQICFENGKSVATLQRVKFETESILHKPFKPVPREIAAEIRNVSRVCGVENDDAVREILSVK